MLLRYPVWDVSYDVAVVFTIATVQDSSTEFSDWAGGLIVFIGATVFEFGSVLLMFEAVNENRSDCFGWAVEETVDGILYLNLSWWPTWYELRTYYFYEIGFLACSSQTFGATVFWISGFTALPPILNSLSTPAENGAYWLPQVIGGTGFIVSSMLFMLEVQSCWYIPAPGVLGWYIGLWNLIGAIGFTLCGALGFGTIQPGVEYALTLSTFIGSWVFLFESLNKYPVWVDEKAGRLER
ncbi:unnamed protein product [Clonostachys chloroleuca]|uniref:Uncharacterized protein n=1 Tax=Clonostachys chloroleuca TaxID=1926264 RepID=A0AA35VLX4_9HYPO|nr:unnamed protein product [Clonostachys chloroleuca]